LWGTLGQFATVAAEFEQAANPVELDLNVSIHAAGISCLEPRSISMNLSRRQTLWSSISMSPYTLLEFPA
jgi:hypothetical protein